MGKHLSTYGGGNLKSNVDSWHYADRGDEPKYSIQFLVDGATTGALGNPWQKIWESSPGGITTPGTLHVLLGDPWGPDTERIAIVWDNAYLVRSQTVTEGEEYTFEVPKVLGDTLSIWMTDNNGVNVTFIPNTQPEKIAKLKKEILQKKRTTLSTRVADAATGAAAATTKATSNLKWTVIALAVLGVAGAIVYLKR